MMQILFTLLYLTGMGLFAFYIFEILTFVFTYFWWIVGAGILARFYLAFTLSDEEFKKFDEQTKPKNNEAHYRVYESDPKSGWKHFWVTKD